MAQRLTKIPNNKRVSSAVEKHANYGKAKFYRIKNVIVSLTSEGGIESKVHSSVNNAKYTARTLSKKHGHGITVNV